MAKTDLEKEIEDLNNKILEMMKTKAFAMLEEGINKSGLDNETKLDEVEAKTTPHSKWVSPMVKSILNRFRAIQGVYRMFPITQEGQQTLITLEKNLDLGNKYVANLGISFEDPENTRRLAIMLHGGELMGDEDAVKDANDGDKEKIIVNAKIGYDGDVANAIGAELSKYFHDYLSKTDHEIIELNKRIKAATLKEQ